ncbi:BTAD domain-containing putative transcriptional regulator [Plantactinospora sp. GCM10030261]|uniref:BTAD domain-containing putative transcriptional regulator n=1 Tax=Plantactinospora sp. GCM10030261 TaxID=3273420 RepID=UPI003616DA76
MTGDVRFQLLGPQRAWTGGDNGERELDLGPGKQRAVLAVLLLQVGHPVSTRHILDAVWQEELPANGPNVVQKYVAGLRRILEPDRSPRAPAQLLSLTDAGYLLRVDPAAVDAYQFEQHLRTARELRVRGDLEAASAELRAGLELWRGEPLSGLAGAYFDAARTRLVENRAAAVELRAELELALGRHQDLAAELVPWVAEFPVREPLRHALMLALHRSGRQAEALMAFRDIRRVLVEEHGLEPGAELRELHARILRDDPTLAPPVVTAATSAAPPPPEPVAEPPVAVVEPPVAVVEPPVRVAEPPAVPVAPAGYPPATYPPQLPAWASAPAPSRSLRDRAWVANVVTVLGALAAAGSAGLLTWIVLLCYGIARRSRWLVGLAIGYAVLSGIFFVYALSSPVDWEPTDTETLVLIVPLMVPWMVGPLHIVLVNRFVLRFFSRLVTGGHAAPTRGRPDQTGRARRAYVRHLLYQHPTSRMELRIGRPDLPRLYDDGGLVDVNSVADHVLQKLPGLRPEQARQISMDRWLRGPYASMEELAARCLLLPEQAEDLRDYLLFLPPMQPMQPMPPIDRTHPVGPE